MFNNYVEVYENFYRIRRLGANRLPGDGGPFGFDIHAAIMVDYAIRKFSCDAIIETGCFAGDTTEYLVRKYPDLTVISCDIVEDYQSFTKERVSFAKNATVLHGSSNDIVREYANKFKFPFLYLDAHWYEYWPIDDEISSVDSGILCIDDFDIKNGRYGFDVYKGRTCGPEILRPFSDKIKKFYTNNPEATMPFPCLQPARRSGRAFVPVGKFKDFFAESQMFLQHSIDEIAERANGVSFETNTQPVRQRSERT